jgi:hypothetical protein
MVRYKASYQDFGMAATWNSENPNGWLNYTRAKEEYDNYKNQYYHAKLEKITIEVIEENIK